MVISQLYGLVRESRGNDVLTFALSLVPIVFLTGLGMDFTATEQRKKQLDAAADAAAPAAVTPVMMAQPNTSATTAAQNLFQLEDSSGQISGCDATGLAKRICQML